MLEIRHNAYASIHSLLMPRQFFRRWLPTPKTIEEHKALRWLGPVVSDPHLFHLNKHSVSVAFFAGLFCAFLPLPGHMAIVALLAILLRCNLPLALMLVWISNPLTMAPMLVLSYQVGLWVLNVPPGAVNWEFNWTWLSHQGTELLTPLFIGSLVTGLISGLIGFVSIRIVWRWKVVRRWETRKKLRASDSD